jgi:hypothetical protein
MSKEFDFETPAQTQQKRIDFQKVFFNPEKGINLIRIVSLNGQSFKSHYMATKTGEKKFVKCPGAGCPICIEGKNKATTRYLLKIIDRKTGDLKVWEFGSQIKTQIQEYVNDIKARLASGQTDPDDKLTEYNVEVRRREPGANPLYGISVRERITNDPRQAAVVAADAKVIAADTIDLKELTKPWSVERINSQIYGIESAGSPAPQTSTAAAPAPKVSYPSAGTAAVSKPDVKALAQGASALGSEDDSWLN